MALMMKSFQKRGKRSKLSRRDENKYDVDFAFYYTCKYAIREFIAEMYGIDKNKYLVRTGKRGKFREE
jgi:ribosomal protein S24E